MTTEPTIGVRAQARRDTSRRIREAAIALLAERTIDDITTKEVAERAGVGEGTLFRHIPNKRTLLTLAYGDIMDALLDDIERADAAAEMKDSPSGDDFYQRALAVFEARSKFYLANPANASAYLRHAYDPQNNDPGRNNSQGDRIIRLVESILRSGQTARLVGADVDPFRVAENCHAIFVHEVERTPVRGWDPSDFWERLRDRLDAQLRLLFVDGALR